MNMVYNAIPTSQTQAKGFHHEVRGQTVSTTWADLVSFFLEQAETRFGPRDARWFFTGIAFNDRGPQLQFPANRPNHVMIQLSTSAANDPQRSYFQLAHEVAHLLGPNRNQQHTNYLEEGMCTSFQIEMSQAVGITNFGDLGTYEEALDLVRDLQAFDPDAIKKLRATCPDLRSLDAGKFGSVLAGVPTELGAKLVRDFPLR